MLLILLILIGGDWFFKVDFPKRLDFLCLKITSRDDIWECKYIPPPIPTVLLNILDFAFGAAWSKNSWKICQFEVLKLNVVDVLYRCC